jgi:hypothetical protein
MRKIFSLRSRFGHLGRKLPVYIIVRRKISEMKLGMLVEYWQYFFDSLKDAKTIVSIASATLSATSLYYTRRFWLATNRPIISASIVSNEPGNIAITYNLVVYNTGNRPATSIRIHADKEMLDKIIYPDAQKELIDVIHKCFSSEAVIPLLINGKESLTFFGITSKDTGKNVLKYNSQLPILISYSDLENRNYKSSQVLVVRVSQGFAGTRSKPV